MRKLVLSALFLLIVPLVSGQSHHPTHLSGIVTDATGASLTKARVLVVNLETLDTKRTEAALDGAFDFAVVPGEYAVIVVTPSDAPCWKPSLKQLRVKDGAVTRMRIALILDTEKCSER